MNRSLFILLFTVSLYNCTTAQKTASMKDKLSSEIVSIADTFKLADDVMIPYLVGDRFGFCDKNQKMILKPKYTMATPFYYGYAGVVAELKDGGGRTAASYIDRRGKEISDYIFNFINPFQENSQAVVQVLGGQWGVIDTTGNFVIPFGFEKIFYLKDLNLYLVQLKGKYGLVDENNNIKLPIEYDEIFHNKGSKIISVEKNKKWGFLTRELNLIIPIEYDYAYISDSSDSLFYAQKNGSSYIMDINQQKLLDVSGYEMITNFNKKVGVAIKRIDDEPYWGVIDIQNGKEILPCKYGPIWSFENGVAPIQVYVDDNIRKAGLITEEGTFVIQPQFKFLFIEHDFIFSYKEKENSTPEYFVFNFKGKLLFNPQFCPGPFENSPKTGLYKHKNLDAEPELAGVIDKTGKVIIETLYENLDDEGFDKYGLILAKRQGIYFYIDVLGTEYKK